MQAFQQPIFQPYGVQPTLPPGWVEHYTAQAQPYWFNTLTQQSSWVFPMAPAEPPKKKKQTKYVAWSTPWQLLTNHHLLEKRFPVHIGSLCLHTMDTNFITIEKPKSLFGKCLKNLKSL